MRYLSTRDGSDAPASFDEVVRQGTAPDGGLYVPDEIPVLPPEELEGLAALSYAEAAFRVISAFHPGLPDQTLRDILSAAYPGAFQEDEPAPLRADRSGCCPVLELWHGPTAAFKDLALQVLPRFMAACSDEGEEQLVLVATSGDTGSAALEGFADRPGVRCAVFYPVEGVSGLQRLQMTTREAGNIEVFAVEGDFDACQQGVKALMADPSLTARLLDRHAITLASANSINWGRILPQIVYYAVSWSHLRAAGLLGEEEVLDVCVPTGNFGNILAAWYARRMGIPLGRLVCATNRNDVLAEFLATGRYDTAGRDLHRTPTPSMDILRASNLERLLYHLTEGDGEQVRSWMGQLDGEGEFEVDPSTLARVRETFLPASAGDDEILETLQRRHAETGEIIDPHTAAARYAAEHTHGEETMLVVSTAHWSKFPGTVVRALEGMRFEEPLPSPLRGQDPFGLLRHVAAKTGAEIHPSIRALEGAPEVHDTPPLPPDGLEIALLSWLEEFRRGV
ncbi:MAG: threonine synthase [bacterium]